MMIMHNEPRHNQCWFAHEAPRRDASDDGWHVWAGSISSNMGTKITHGHNRPRQELCDGDGPHPAVGVHGLGAEAVRRGGRLDHS